MHGHVRNALPDMGCPSCGGSICSCEAIVRRLRELCGRCQGTGRIRCTFQTPVGNTLTYDTVCPNCLPEVAP